MVLLLALVVVTEDMMGEDSFWLCNIYIYSQSHTLNISACKIPPTPRITSCVPSAFREIPILPVVYSPNDSKIRLD